MIAPAAASPAAAAAATSAFTLTSCFVYGTLMSPEVVRTLIGRVPSTIDPAFLPNHSRHPVRRQVFPGVIPSTATTDVGVRGLLLTDLNQHEMDIFDWFEDIDYKRTNVRVLLPKDSTVSGMTIKDVGKVKDGWIEVETQTYIWADSVADLDTTKPWDYDFFRREKLAWYLRNTVSPCRAELDSFS